jgi:transposase-like protein
LTHGPVSCIVLLDGAFLLVTGGLAKLFPGLFGEKFPQDLLVGPVSGALLGSRHGGLLMDMDLGKLMTEFGTDDLCREYLEDLRWPDGVRCLRCGSDKISRIGWKTPKGRRQYDCGSCRYRFSVTAGTVLHDSHLPLWKWFAATYLMIESRKGISANQLRRTLKVAHKTAWYLTHRIRAAMRDDFPQPLEGVVEIDETYIGGKAKHVGKGKGYDNKTMVLGAIQRGGKVQMRARPKLHPSTPILQAFIDSVVSQKATNIYTDSGAGYRQFHAKDSRHDQVDHGSEEWVRGDVSTNSIENAWSLLKRSIVGSYHNLSVKHLPAYLDEFSFRFNGRENPMLFRDTILRLIGEEPLRYKELVSSHPAS